ncbi:MAG: helix-turn-helix domain-containing protein [Firmicutes bacterium]|nr:helix-turn-helix domain-containing protein [Bacillota bacterium]
MNNILLARKSKDITQKEIALLLGIEQSAVSKWERGDAVPRKKHLLKLSEILQVSTDYLLGLTNDTATNVETVQANNGIAFSRNSTLTMYPQQRELSKEKAEMLNIYDRLNVKGRHSLLAYLFKLEENPEYADI